MNAYTLTPSINKSLNLESKNLNFISSLLAGRGIEILNEGQYSWLLQPLVYKLYNAQDQGDYNKGINPTFVVDEFSKLKLYVLVVRKIH